MEVINRLFRIKVLHAGPKDYHTAIETYLVSDSDESVFNWINKTKCRGYWFSIDDEDCEVRYDEESDTEIPFREWVMKNRGDLHDEEGWSDAYYGITKWGWEPVEATQNEIDTLVKLGIAEIE